MILPIVLYKNPILKEKAKEIDPLNPSHNLDDLIKIMFDTMYKANGVGLAAPQIGLSLRIFVVDSASFFTQGKTKDLSVLNFKKVFINPKILIKFGRKWHFSEGCLSIPNIIANVKREEEIKIEYFDEKWVRHTENFSGIPSRIIQHEYDHLEGILFIDHLSEEKIKKISPALKKVEKGEMQVPYLTKPYL